MNSDVGDIGDDDRERLFANLAMIFLSNVDTGLSEEYCVFLECLNDEERCSCKQFLIESKVFAVDDWTVGLEAE